MIDGLIVGHGDYSESLIRALSLISGETSGVTGISNEGKSTNDLSDEIKASMEKSPEKECIVFVDIYGGSCWRAAMMAKTEHSRVITGVNLPMLLSFVNKRQNLTTIQELSEVLVADVTRYVILN